VTILQQLLQCTFVPTGTAMKRNEKMKRKVERTEVETH
jgi:hypothetical protein